MQGRFVYAAEAAAVDGPWRAGNKKSPKALAWGSMPRLGARGTCWY